MRVLYILSTVTAVYSKPSKIESDLYSFPQYELIVNSSLSLEDFKNDNEFKIVKIGKEKWECLIPIRGASNGNDDSEESRLQTLPDPGKTAARLSAGMPCLYQIQDGRYWQYEYCPTRAVKQFHPLPQNVQPGKNDEYYLGVHTKKVVPYIVEDVSADGVKYHYLKEIWGDGTVCDLNGERRQTTIEYYCAQEEKFESIRETSSCNYRIVVNTPKLCFHPAFLRQRPSKIAKIQCKPSKVYRKDQDELGAVSMETFMGFEKPKKKKEVQEQQQQQVAPKVINLGSFDSAQALEKLIAELSQIGIVDPDTEDIGDVDLDSLGVDVSVVYIKDANTGKMKKVERSKGGKSDSTKQESVKQESVKQESSKHENAGDASTPPPSNEIPAVQSQNGGPPSSSSEKDKSAADTTQPEANEEEKKVQGQDDSENALNIGSFDSPEDFDRFFSELGQAGIIEVDDPELKGEVNFDQLDPDMTVVYIKDVKTGRVKRVEKGKKETGKEEDSSDEL